MAPCPRMRSPSHDARVQKHAVDGLGNGVSNRKPWSGLIHRETRNTLAHGQPPVEPALYHRGSLTVVGEGWDTQPRDPAAAAGAGHPPDCVLAQVYSPRSFNPAPITTQHNTTQHNTTQHNTTQHNTTQHNTTQHSTTQHNTTQHNTTQHNTTRHDKTQHNTTQHNTTQHNTRL